MPAYRAPLRDMQFVFDELLDAYATLQSLPTQREFSNDLGGAILEEAAKLAENVLAPVNGPGDKQGCQYDPATHSVKTPDGLRPLTNSLLKVAGRHWPASRSSAAKACRTC